MDAQASVQSPFLPGTNIQYAWAIEKACYLIDNAIQNGDCLDCHLAPNAKGYSPISFGRAHKMRAHRLIYYAFNPQADPELLVLHKCDNRRCINIEHLFPGTAQDNTDDMIAKGRKVDDPEVGLRRRIATAECIRPLYKQGLNNAQIARKLYLSPSTVGRYTLAFSAGYEYPICV